jgi:hypothetical protein
MLEFRVLPGGPRGHRAGAIHLRTNVPQQPDWLAAFQAAIFDDVVPEPSFLQLGAVRRGEGFERDVRLVSRSGRPFAVERVDDASGRAAVRAVNCDGGNSASRCWSLRVRVASAQEGTLRGELAIRIAGDPEPLPLPYAGLVAAADARIEELGAIGDGTIRREADPREPAP